MKDTILSGKFTINCGGKLISLDQPKVMGIVNCTPDSFYDGGKTNTIYSALEQIEKHLIDGATFIDVGGYSSRPGAGHISTDQEIHRVIPIITEATWAFPEIHISIDTFRSDVARAAVSAGAQSHR